MAAAGQDLEILPSGLTPAEVEERPYLDYVRECIKLVVDHGTDRYGNVCCPVLMNILDVRTRTFLETPLALDEAFRVTRRGRRGPAGGNLYSSSRHSVVMNRLGFGLRTNQPNKTTQAKQATDGEQYWPIIHHLHRLSDDDNKSAKKQDNRYCLIHRMSYA